MKITKSSRHQKIIGDYGEQLICNFLSRSGYEVAVINHTGIDIIAYSQKTDKRLGITVKSRTRGTGTEGSSVTVFSYQKGKNDRKKVIDACKSFACEPWIAIYVEQTGSADAYITSLHHYEKEYKDSKSKNIDTWKMSHNYTARYQNDPLVKHIRFLFHFTNWLDLKK